jgi:hypothetical protein
MEDRGELFREREEAAVGGRLLIAQRIHETTGREASASDAGGKPRAVDFREEAGDLAPTGALAALLESPTRTTKRFRPWRVASTMQCGPGPTRLPKAARSWRRMAAGCASV